jgi:hypothetical protein
MRQSVGLDRTRCRPVTCATTNSVAERRTLQVSPSESTYGHSPVPMNVPGHDIIAGVSNRFRLPPSHPILAAIVTDPANWFHFERLDDDNPATLILGHDTPSDGRMTIFVACASDEVRQPWKTAGLGLKCTLLPSPHCRRISSAAEQQRAVTRSTTS